MTPRFFPTNVNTAVHIERLSGFIIEMPRAYERRDESSYVAINFENNGFKSLDEHRNEKGSVDITLPRMCYLYAIAIQNRLQEILQDCEFSRVSMDRNLDALGDNDFLFCIGLLTNIGKYAKFSYRVPVPETSSLF